MQGADLGDEMRLLYQVQQADTEIARLRQALAELDSGAGLEAELTAGEAELARLRADHHATESELTVQNLELRTLEEKRDRFRAQLYGGTVHNPRQLGDLQGEVEMLSREIGRLEERVLELMEAMEEQREALREREAQQAAIRRQLEEVRAKYEEASARLRAEVAEMERHREEAAQQVSPRLLKRYDQIRARQGNLGIVRVTGPTCPGCHIAFPSDTLKSLKAGREQLACDNCGRLLFWDPSDSD